MPPLDSTPRPTGVEPLVLVRHASTAWTKSGQHTGRTDLPLDDDGVAAAKALASTLAPYRGALVCASPLHRALETCALSGLADHVEADPDLEEWDYGEYEGWTSAEIERVRPGWELFRDGCPDGESAKDVGARADRFLDRIAATVGPVVVFGHGHALRVLAARWLEQPAEDGRLFVLSAPSVSQLGWEHGGPTIQTWNH
jgi:broad specificity phosphatase PhoE